MNIVFQINLVINALNSKLGLKLPVIVNQSA